MQFIRKEFIDNKTRIIYIFNIPIKYTKTFDEIKEKPIYHISFLGINFSFEKKQRCHKQRSITHITKENKEDSLMCAKCIRNFYEKKDNIETLIFGASTARCSYIEDEKSVSFAIDAQDLYYSYQLLLKYIYQAPKLKNIVLYWDVFSIGNDMEVSPYQKHRCAFYKTFFDIPYKNKLLNITNEVVKLEKKLYSLDKYITKNLDSVPKDYIPMLSSGFMSDNKLLRWVRGEIKLSQKPVMREYLRAMLKEIEKNNLKLYIVISPRNPRAKRFYPSVQELFKDLYSELKEFHNYQIIDVFQDAFEEEEFVDLLHLNPKGAKKITKIINDLIYTS